MNYTKVNLPYPGYWEYAFQKETMMKWCREFIGPGARATNKGQKGVPQFKWYSQILSMTVPGRDVNIWRWYFEDPSHATLFALKWAK